MTQWQSLSVFSTELLLFVFVSVVVVLTVLLWLSVVVRLLVWLSVLLVVSVLLLLTLTFFAIPPLLALALPPGPPDVAELVFV